MFSGTAWKDGPEVRKFGSTRSLCQFLGSYPKLIDFRNFLEGHQKSETVEHNVDLDDTKVSIQPMLEAMAVAK